MVPVPILVGVCINLHMVHPYLCLEIALIVMGMEKIMRSPKDQLVQVRARLIMVLEVDTIIIHISDRVVRVVVEVHMVLLRHICLGVE